MKRVLNLDDAVSIACFVLLGACSLVFLVVLASCAWQILAQGGAR